MSLNHARTKRLAHLEGRIDAGWNPFGHPWASGKRSQTWNGKEEAGEAHGEPVPITHASTAPSPTSRPTSSGESGANLIKHGPDDDTIQSGPNNSRAHLNGSVRQRTTFTSSGKDTSARGPEQGGDDGKKKEKKSHRLFKNLTPKEPFTPTNQVRRTFFNSWINVLLLFAPVGIALNYVSSINRVVVFVVNFIAIIPLAAMLSFATEEIALRTGETLGGLLNATFGNAVELIVAIMALTQKPAKIVIVQTSLIGSILSNLLLVLGMCFFFGGLQRPEQFFNTTVAQTAASLLALAVASIIIPTVFDHNSPDTSNVDVPALSRGTAVILLVVYGAYLLFQLKTHHSVFSAESQKVAAKPWKTKGVKEGAVGEAMASLGGTLAANRLSDKSEFMRNPNDEDEAEEPQLSFPVAVATLTVSTVVIAFCAEFMVDSIDAVTKSGGLSEEFVGLILLPIVGNAAEHATAVTVAIKDKMDLAIGVAVGSSMQVALFLIPLLVVIGWGMGLSDMNLSFDIFQVAVLFVSVLLVNYLIADGKSHWLEGMLLMCLYFIIAVCSWWYPANTSSTGF